MSHRHILGLLILVVGTQANAAFRFGLGDAVAKRSAQLITEAGEVDAANATGDSVAATLPHCRTGTIYDAPPTDISMVAGIDPLGHVFPSGHTFPSDHIYYYSSTTTVVTMPVYAPGNLHITEVVAQETINLGYTDYSIYFYPCRELKSYYHHVRTLSRELSSQVGQITDNCTVSSSGGNTYRRCSRRTNLVFRSGDLLGYAVQSGTFDFGTYDYRITPLNFISPQRLYSDKLYTVCPIDYFDDSSKAAMRAKLGRTDGSYRRTTEPICGGVMFDVAGTAQGDWYAPGSPDIPEDPHLALIQDNVFAPKQQFSYGTSLPNASPYYYTFDPTSAGLVNRDFSQVTADGNTYCYDSFLELNGNVMAGGPTFLIAMPSATTLRLEKQNPSSCGVGPWTFTSNAVTFQR